MGWCFVCGPIGHHCSVLVNFGLVGSLYAFVYVWDVLYEVGVSTCAYAVLMCYIKFSWSRLGDFIWATKSVSSCFGVVFCAGVCFVMSSFFSLMWMLF